LELVFPSKAGLGTKEKRPDAGRFSSNQLISFYLLLN